MCTNPHPNCSPLKHSPIKNIFINTALYTQFVSVKRLDSGHGQQVLKIFLLIVGCDDSMVREGGVVAEEYIIHAQRSHHQNSLRM